MAEISSFFNDLNGDREYDAEIFALYFKQFLSNGLYHRNNVPALLVRKGAGTTTTMDPGSAYIEGYMYVNTELETFSHGLADNTNPRVDRIVLRLDRSLNVRAINAVVKMGVPAKNPLPPALERNDVVYEISLAQVRINAGVNEVYSVVDERLDPNVAGLVSSLITAPTDGLLQDWNTFMDKVQNSKLEYEADWAEWVSGMNAQKDAYISAWQTWFNGMEASRQKYNDDWNRWFTGIQNPNVATGGMNISVGKIPHTNPILNDIWIDTND